VPFPREWYGSPDELVPIDLAPPEADATDAAGSGATEAAAFWEGGAGTDHELADPSDQRRRDPATSRSAVHTEPAPTSDRPNRPKAASRRVAVRPLAVAALLAVVWAGVAAVVVSGLGARHGTDPGGLAQRQQAARALTETVTTPVTVTATAPARGTRGERPATHTHTGSAAGSRPDSGTAAAQQSAAAKQTAALEEPAPSSVTSTPAATGGSSQSPGAGCTQSPDSGCLP
jgi:hypothetical protein